MTGFDIEDERKDKIEKFENKRKRTPAPGIAY